MFPITLSCHFYWFNRSDSDFDMDWLDRSMTLSSPETPDRTVFIISLDRIGSDTIKSPIRYRSSCLRLKPEEVGLGSG